MSQKLKPFAEYIQNLNYFDKIDLYVTKWLYQLFNHNELLYHLPDIFGRIPYEIYVIPGMLLATLQMIWQGTQDVLQTHLLPHWMAYSIFQNLKKKIDRKRPGCFIAEFYDNISVSHCTNKLKCQSFPSGHTGIMFSLATALYLQMNCSVRPSFFNVLIKSPKIKSFLVFASFFIAFFVALHRITKY